MEETLEREETIGESEEELTEYSEGELSTTDTLNRELVEHDSVSMVLAPAPNLPQEGEQLPIRAEDFTSPAPVQPTGTSTAFAMAAEELEWLTTLAQLAAKSGLYPGQKPSELMMKAMVGHTIGLKAAQSFQHIVMIRANPSFGAELQRSLLKRWKLQIKQTRLDGWKPEDDQKYCLLALYDQTTGELLGEASFTIQEANQAGLMRSDAWQKWTSDMLFARSSTRLITRFAPWILFGLPEDLE